MRQVALVVALLTVASSIEALTLDGTVRTEDGTRVPQIVLRLEGATSRSFVSGQDGRIRLADLDAGPYRIVSETPGFAVAGDGQIEVTADGPVDVVLTPAAVREHIVVTATRGATPISALGASVTALDARQIAARETPAITTLLEAVPGVATARTGGLGSQGSAFIRGGNSNGVRLIVDGVPVNQPGGGFDLGPSLAFEIEQLEVVRGASSSLYGSDGIAGALQLVTRRGDTPSLKVEAEGGNRDFWRGVLGTSGRRGRYDWNLTALSLGTDNQEPNNAFQSRNVAFSGGADLGQRGTLRLVVRGSDASVGTPGQTAFGQKDLDASTDHRSLAAGVVWRTSGPRLTHEVRGGVGIVDQHSRNPLDSGAWTPAFGGVVGPYEMADFPSAEGYRNETERFSFGYQATAQAAPAHLVTAGVEMEREAGDIGTRGSPDFLEADRTNLGAYLQDQWTLGSRAFLTAGLRLEHNGSFGTAVVPRAALAVRVRSGPSPATFKASAGAGIKEPAFLESFGRASYAEGNPDLRPEKSTTFDLGLEQRLASGRLRGEVTLFHHEYRDLITYTMTDPMAFLGTYVNLGKTRARGVECVIEAAPHRLVRFLGQLTHLDGVIVESGNALDPIYAKKRELLRRPRNQASGTLSLGDSRITGSMSVVFAGERTDSDFLGLGLESNEAYTRVDARVRANLARGLDVVLVAENLLDREYMEVLGYPALGRSVRFGLRYRTGVSR